MAFIDHDLIKLVSISSIYISCVPRTSYFKRFDCFLFFVRCWPKGKEMKGEFQENVLFFQIKNVTYNNHHTIKQYKLCILNARVNSSAPLTTDDLGFGFENN